MNKIDIRDLQCENCRKFSHCNNNDLVCITKFQQLKAENEKLKYFLDKIRDEELSNLDIEWDEYETNCINTDYSNIINLVEKALGEQDE